MTRAPLLGGAFGLETPVSPSPPPFSAANTQYFLNVRCALLALAQALRPCNVWLPSYLCPALLEPFQSSAVEARYYGVDEHLRVAGCGWLNDVHPGDFVIVIHYFGLPHSSFPACAAKRRGAYIIEDSSQALFLPQQFEESLCVLYSPRKFLGVPDGGVMASKEETGTEALALQPPPGGWWSSALAMMLQRRDFDLTGQPSDWYSLFQRVESNFPLGFYRSSDLSRAVLTCGVDYEAIRTRRRANYQALLDMLGVHALFPEIPEQAVPLGFPVRIEAGIRDRVLRLLHANRIYAPVHWKIDGGVPTLSLLTLVCDQRYSPDDMTPQAHRVQEGSGRRSVPYRNGHMSLLQQGFAEAMERAPANVSASASATVSMSRCRRSGKSREAEHSSAEILRHRQRFSRTIAKSRLDMTSGAPPGPGSMPACSRRWEIDAAEAPGSKTFVVLETQPAP